MGIFSLYGPIVMKLHSNDHWSVQMCIYGLTFLKLNGCCSNCNHKSWKIYFGSNCNETSQEWSLWYVVHLCPRLPLQWVLTNWVYSRIFCSRKTKWTLILIDKSIFRIWLTELSNMSRGLLRWVQLYYYRW